MSETFWKFNFYIAKNSLCIYCSKIFAITTYICVFTNFRNNESIKICEAIRARCRSLGANIVAHSWSLWSSAFGAKAMGLSGSRLRSLVSKSWLNFLDWLIFRILWFNHFFYFSQNLPCSLANFPRRRYSQTAAKRIEGIRRCECSMEDDHDKNEQG